MGEHILRVLGTLVIVCPVTAMFVVVLAGGLGIHATGLFTIELSPTKIHAGSSAVLFVTSNRVGVGLVGTGHGFGIGGRAAGGSAIEESPGNVLRVAAVGSDTAACVVSVDQAKTLIRDRRRF